MLPKHLQGILWSTSVDKLDLSKNKVYIIHQVLMYGKLEDIQWLFDTYSHKEVREVFITKPQKIYSEPAFNFVNDYILKIENNSQAKAKYVNAAY